MSGGLADLRERVPSVLHDDEAEWLREMAADRTVCEIGSYLGFTALLMAETAKQVVAVDWHKGDPHSGPTDTLQAFRENTKETSNLVAVVCRSETACRVLARNRFNLVFVDGGHEFEQVAMDVRLAWEICLPGGTIVFHDYRYRDLEVSTAVDGFAELKARKVYPGPGSMAWIVK